MTDNLPSEFNLNVLGVYDSFDTLVKANFSSKDINDPLVAQHIGGHEQLHFFQNFFTLQGLSYYHVVRFIETLTEDLLLDWQAPIPIPVYDWLKSLPELKGNRSSAFYYDRFSRLFNQLSTAHESNFAVADWMHKVKQVDMVRILNNRLFKLDVEKRTFIVDNVPVFQIDYSAICESMTKSMEYFSRAATYTSFDIREQHSIINKDPDRERDLYNAISKDMATPSLLNYTFSLLYLRQSGYNIEEAIQLTIVLSYIALMNNVSTASLPELGIEHQIKFGTISSGIYSKLLQDAYDDKFLDVFKRLLSNPSSFSSIVDYMDEIASISGCNNVSKGHDVLQNHATFFIDKLHAQGLPRNLWFIRILQSSKEFCMNLKNKSTFEGLSLILSPSMFMYNSNVGPAISCTDNTVYILKNPESVLSELATFSYSLNSVKTLLFGWGQLYIPPDGTRESSRIAFNKYLHQFRTSVYNI